jgi:hypothetical protein
MSSAHAAWSHAAAQLGLCLEGGIMHGRLQGYGLRIQRIDGGVNVACWLDLPMDLGLQAWQRRAVGPTLTFPPTPVRAGDPEVDHGYLVFGDEPGRVALLLAGQTRELLLRPPHGGQLYLSDHNLSLVYPGFLNTERLVQAAQGTLQATAVVDRARAKVPAASHLSQHAAAWTSYARSSGLRFMYAPLSMWGTVGGADVAAYVVRCGPSLAYSRVSSRLHVQVRFAHYLDLGLLIRAEVPMDVLAVFFGPKDVRLGDPAFDRTFLVKASAPDRVRALLDDHVRAALLGVHHHVGPVMVDDEGVSVDLPMVPRDPTVIPRVVQELSSAVTAISRACGARTGGAYR